MISFRGAALTLCLGVLVLSVGTVRAADDSPRRSRTEQPDRWTLFAQSSLLSPRLQERLDLSDRQKEKIARLQKEFADKSKDADQAGRKLLAKAIQDGDWESFHDRARDHFEASTKQYAEYHDKVLAVLTDEQKDKLDSLMPLPGLVRPWARPADQEKKPQKETERKPASSSDVEKKLDRLMKEVEELRQELRRNR